VRRSRGRIRGNDEAIHQVEQGVRHLPDLWMSRHHDIERQSDARAYLLGVAVPHEIHPSRTVQRKDLADMTKARITKRTNTVLARNRDLAQHGLLRKPYTIQDIRKLAVALSTGRLLRPKGER